MSPPNGPCPIEPDVRVGEAGSKGRPSGDSVNRTVREATVTCLVVGSPCDEYRLHGLHGSCSSSQARSLHCITSQEVALPPPLCRQLSQSFGAGGSRCQPPERPVLAPCPRTPTLRQPHSSTASPLHWRLRPRTPMPPSRLCTVAPSSFLCSSSWNQSSRLQGGSWTQEVSQCAQRQWSDCSEMLRSASTEGDGGVPGYHRPLVSADSRMGQSSSGKLHSLCRLSTCP